MPELRRDPISGDEVLFAPGRADRPGGAFRGGQLEDDRETCPFCRGRESRTPPATASYPAYEPDWRVRVVPNLYPALVARDSSRLEPGPCTDDKPRWSTARGIHEVVVETAEHLVHPLTIPETDMAYVYQAYRDRLSEYRSRPHLRHALAFKNHGLEAGASLAHAHSQLVGFARVPRQVRQRLRLAERFFQRHRRCLICAELDQALQSGHRLVCLDPTFAALCPFAPRFPWETWIIPRRHCSHFERDGETAPAAIWQIVAGVLQRLEGIAGQLSFNLVLQTAPFDLCHEDHYHWYIMILPRFSRQAGFEWGSGCLINPLLPERAAEMLRKS